MLDFVFSSTILGVPLKGRMLYYFPHILVEYNTWIYNLHIYISCDLCEKNAIYSAKNISGSSWWTMDLLKEVQFIWNFLSQDKKKVTF